MAISKAPYKIGKRTIYAASLEDAKAQALFYRQKERWILKAQRTGNRDLR